MYVPWHCVVARCGLNGKQRGQQRHKQQQVKQTNKIYMKIIIKILQLYMQCEAMQCYSDGFVFLFTLPLVHTSYTLAHAYSHCRAHTECNRRTITLCHVCCCRECFFVYYIQFQYYLMRFWRFLYVSCSEAPAPHTHTQSCRRPASMQFCYISMHFGWHTGSGVWNITASQKRIVDAHQHTQSERWIEM